MMPIEQEREMPMFKTGLLGLLALQTPAHAGEELLRYDHYADVGDAYMFSGGLGLVAGECWATVFVPDEESLPIRPLRLQVLLGGSSAELLTQIWMYTSPDLITAAMMNSGTAETIDREEWLFRDIDPGGTMFELDLIDEVHIKNVLLDSGSVAISICFENEQGAPMAMMDYDRFEGEVDTGSDFMSGDRHLILLGGGGGPWETLYDFTYDYLGAPWDTDGDFVPDTWPGDFVMRLVVETEASPLDDDALEGDQAEIYTITPNVQEEGKNVDVLIRGMSFEDGTTAKIGTLDVSGISLSNHNGECENGACCLGEISCLDLTRSGCETERGVFYEGVSCMSQLLVADDIECGTSTEPGTCAHNLNGQTDSELKPGTYDVTISTPSGREALLSGAFKVEAKKGCGCAVGGGLASTWWLGLAALGWRRRRQD
jgi:hypothetical protein